MRGPVLLARAFTMIFALTAGLAGAAAAAHIPDSAGGPSVGTTVGVESFSVEDHDRDSGKDRDKDRRGKQVERSGQSAANDEDEDTADADTADEDTADTDTVDTDTETTEDEDTNDDTNDDDTDDDDTKDQDTGDDDTGDGD